MILATGDSFTYGEELDNRLEQAWPYLIGQYLNQPVDNLGKCGSSNDTIISSVISALSRQQYSLVIVGWTSWGRFDAWNELISMPVTIMPGSKIKLPWLTDYYRYSFNDEYAMQKWSEQVLLLQQYLKSKNQPYLFINVAGLYKLPEKYNYLWDQIDQDCYVGWPEQGMIELTRTTERGPGGHPLTEGHIKIANEIAKYIRP